MRYNNIFTTIIFSLQTSLCLNYFVHY